MASLTDAQRNQARILGLMLLGLKQRAYDAIREGASGEFVVNSLVYPALQKLPAQARPAYDGPAPADCDTREDALSAVYLSTVQQFVRDMAAAEAQPIHAERQYIDVVLPMFEALQGQLLDVRQRFGA